LYLRAKVLAKSAKVLHADNSHLWMYTRIEQGKEVGTTMRQEKRDNQALIEEWSSESDEKQMPCSNMAGFFSEECCKTNSENHA